MSDSEECPTGRTITIPVSVLRELRAAAQAAVEA